MAIIWAPGIWKNSTVTLYKLPLPVTSYRVISNWAANVQIVPGAPGGIATSKHEAPTSITIQGRVSKQGDGTLLSTEAAILSEIDAFKAQAQGETDKTFWIFSHYDAANAEYRFRKEAITASLEFDLEQASRLLVPYTLVLRTTDVTLYSSAAGSLST